LIQAARRVGLFGGAFDPPHRAHAFLAAAAVDQLQLDELFILPTGQPWHRATGLAPAEHRLAMARMAFSAVPRAVVDDRELRRSGTTYTIDTLRELAGERPGAALYLLIGADQAAAFDRWRDWQAIAALATLAVAGRARPGSAAPDEAAIAALAALPGVRLLRLDVPLLPESATDIRARLAAGQDIAPLVDPGVASYIARHNLYQKN